MIELPSAASPRVLTPTDPLDLDTLVVGRDGAEPTSATAVLERWGAVGLVALHDGGVVVDHRAAGIDPDRPQRCYSVTKSLTGTVLADLVARGLVGRSDRVGEIVTELHDSGFGDATVGDLADMTVSLDYAEDYADIGGGTSDGPGHDFGDYVVALGLEGDGAAVAPGAPRDIRSLLRRIGRGSGRHGRVFRYATPATDAAGWLVEVVTGRTVADHVRELVWDPAGPEHPARWSTDPLGVASVGAGLAMTTRDLARVGLLLCTVADGSRPGGSVTRSALDAARRGGDPAAFAADGHYAYLRGYSYRDQWWLAGGPHRPLTAWGIFGQFLWIDPEARVVIACHCRHDDPSAADRDLDQDALCRALVDELARR